VKKRGAVRKGVGRPRGRKKTPEGVGDREVMTLQEVADYLNCHYGTAYGLARQGIMPSFKMGGNWRVLKSEIDEWIKKGGGRQR
jgi:excisionase family DNA binding protein